MPREAKGNPYLKGVLGDAAAAAGKTKTLPGERHRRLARRGKLKALVGVVHTILVIICVRRGTLLFRTDVKDRPSPCRRTQPEPAVAGEGGSSLDKVAAAWHCRMGRAR